MNKDLHKWLMLESEEPEIKLEESEDMIGD